jgi:hypothetical protein
MALTEHNTLWRDRKFHVKITPVRAFLRAFFHWIKPRKHPHIKELSAHYARDIGLSDNDIAYHKHRMPSQHTHHPYG